MKTGAACDLSAGDCFRTCRNSCVCPLGGLMSPSATLGALLLPPQNVTLISENFYTFLTWQPALDSTDNTQYEVERTNGDRTAPEWIRETSCRGSHLRQTQKCPLHLPHLFSAYQARVRARDGSRLSAWAPSNGLQLYKDTVVGPLTLSLATGNRRLCVSVALPRTPLKESDSYLASLKILAVLRGEGGFLRKVKMHRHLMKHTFEGVRPNANYCVQARVTGQRAKEAVQCIWMPESPTGDYWTFLILASVILSGLVLLGVVGRAFLKGYIHPSSSEIDVLKSLTSLNVNLSALRAVLHLEDDAIASLSMVGLPLDSSSTSAEQGQPGAQWAPPDSCHAQELNDYCANGFVRSSLGHEGPSTSPVATGDTSSSGGLLRDEYPNDRSYRTTLELLETSGHPLPSSTELHSQDSETGFWEWTGKRSKDSGQAGWPLSSAVNIPLHTVKLCTVQDVQGLLQCPSVSLQVGDCGAHPAGHRFTGMSEAPNVPQVQPGSERPTGDASPGL
ncbi:uncharacterized protein LOC123021937 [Varanus komodoensis]|uniref:uncharacterized protein LOC123021937 n=1 Tax=Varanus komodoensis TaxID=61221 RepID=UPI001CF7A429|nr:uncharacterized protein LOC123021937 [Varanus komodoensis]